MKMERELFILKKPQKKRSRNVERTPVADDEPAKVTDSNFNKIVSEHPLALIDFWAAWCYPCRALEPTIEELAREYAGKVFVGKLNVDENPRTAERFNVFSIPTMLITKNGREVERIVGLVPKKHIEAALKKHLG